MCLFCINCGSCGKPLPDALQKFYDSMRVCGACGAEIPVCEITCPACGWKLPTEIVEKSVRDGGLMAEELLVATVQGD